MKVKPSDFDQKYVEAWKGVHKPWCFDLDIVYCRKLRENTDMSWLEDDVNIKNLGIKSIVWMDSDPDLLTAYIDPNIMPNIRKVLFLMFFEIVEYTEEAKLIKNNNLSYYKLPHSTLIAFVGIEIPEYSIETDNENIGCFGEKFFLNIPYFDYLRIVVPEKYGCSETIKYRLRMLELSEVRNRYTEPGFYENIHGKLFVITNHVIKSVDSTILNQIPNPVRLYEYSGSKLVQLTSQGNSCDIP